MRRAIVDSARLVFSTKGYGVANYREIAAIAGVYEPMIYRRFPTKASLFREAVLDPLDDVIKSYLETFDSGRGAGSATVEERVRAFIPPLYALVEKQRDLVLAMLAAEAFHGEELGDLGASFSQSVRRLIDLLAPKLVQKLDAPASLTAAFGLVLGVGLLSATQKGDGKEDLSLNGRMVEELVMFTLYGVSMRPARGGAVTAGSELAELFDRVADAERRAIRAELELAHLKRHLARREGETVADDGTLPDDVQG